MNSYKLYTSTPPWKLYAMVAIPGAISMVASSLWGLFDGIFVGQLVGQTAFAALNLAFPFVMINFSLSDMIGVGSSVPISIALGRKEEKEAGNIFTCACILIVLTGAVMGAIIYAIAPWLMSLLGAEGELKTLAVRYIRVYALWSPLTTMVFATDNYLRICGQIRGSMLLNIAMSVVILALEFLCLGVLDMDIAGSPLAVSLGLFLIGLGSLYPFLRGKLTLKFCRPKFSAAIIRQIVASGGPVFLNNISAHLTGILFNMVLLSMGGPAAVSVYGVLLYAGDLLRQVLYGACDSLQPALGYNWGAGKPERVRAIAGCCLTVASVISIGGGILLYAFPAQISALFLSAPEEEVLSLTVHALRLYSLTFLTRWFGFAIQCFLIALDKPKPATILCITNAFFMPVVLLTLLRPLGLEGIWLNAPITSAVVAVLAGYLLLRLRKQGEAI